MKQVTIKVRDGEVTIPVIGKVIKDGTVIRLIKVFGEGNTAKIKYIYPNVCTSGLCDCIAWMTREFDNIQPCSVEFWNNAVQTSAFAEIEKIVKYAREAIINE